MHLFYLVFSGIFGLLIGSFLNCLIWRLYKEESLLGRSYCPHCRHQIAWYDNFPLLSFIFLGGKCRHCKKSISWQYPIIELTTGILFALAFIKNIGGWFAFQDLSPLDLIAQINSLKFYLSLIRDYFIISVMLIVLIYDLRWYLISNLVIVPAVIVIFVLNIVLGVSWYYSLLMAILSCGFFLAQYLITKKRGLGEGDIWLGFLLGIIFSQVAIWWLMIIISYFLGSVVGLTLMMIGRKKWGSKLPLGVFLASGTIIVLLYGEIILANYQNWIYR